MVQDVVRSVGAGGDFATLVDFAAALPANLVATDERWIAEMLNGAPDPGGAVIQTVCDETRYVVVRAVAGQGPGDLMDPASDVLRAQAGFGAMVETTSGDAISVSGTQTRLAVANLQIVATAGVALADDGTASIVSVTGSILEGNGTLPVVTVRGAGVISHTTVIQRGVGDGITLEDGALAEGCTVTKPSKVVADGLGIRFAGSPAPGARSCFATGFRQAFGSGSGTAEGLVSDQENILGVSDDFADPYWTAIAASVNGGDTVPGPYDAPLQWLGNNLNAFSRFDGPVITSLAPGGRIAFTLIVAQPTALVSAILLDSSAGRPELRVTWTGNPPVVGLLGQVANFAARVGTVTDLGGGTWRLYLEAENTTAAPINVTPSVYVTRDVSNSGLDVGFYGGAMMAGTKHLGTGFARMGAVPGTGVLEGIDPVAALESVVDGNEDLRPLAGGPLESIGVLAGSADIYHRYRHTPDTTGAVTLQAAQVVQGGELVLPSVLDAVPLVDQQDVVTATARRTVMPAVPVRTIEV